MNKKNLLIWIFFPIFIILFIYVYPSIYSYLQTKKTIKQWEKDYKQALEKGNVDYNHLRNIATKYEIEGKYDSAINIWKEALNKKPNDVLAYTRIAILFFYKSNNDMENKTLWLNELIKYANEGEKHAKNNPLDIAQVGRMYEVIKEYDKAIKQYKKALDQFDILENDFDFTLIKKLDPSSDLGKKLKEEISNSLNRAKKKLDQNAVRKN